MLSVFSCLLPYLLLRQTFSCFFLFCLPTSAGLADSRSSVTKKTGPLRGPVIHWSCNTSIFCIQLQISFKLPEAAAAQAMLSISESIWKYLRYSDLLAAGAESYEAIISQLLTALKYALTLSPGAAYSTLALIAAIMLEYAT